MSKPTFKISTRALAKKWGSTSPTISRYAARGCDWDAPDIVVGRWLLKYGMKKPKAMREAIYAVPGITDPHKQPVAMPLPFNPAEFGAVYERAKKLEDRVAKLQPGDIRGAITLQKEVDQLDAKIAQLEATIPRS